MWYETLLLDHIFWLENNRYLGRQVSENVMQWRLCLTCRRKASFDLHMSWAIMMSHHMYSCTVTCLIMIVISLLEEYCVDNIFCSYPANHGVFHLRRLRNQEHGFLHHSSCSILSTKTKLVAWAIIIYRTQWFVYVAIKFSDNKSVWI
jgi:hypothetical protein